MADGTRDKPVKDHGHSTAHPAADARARGGGLGLRRRAKGLLRKLISTSGRTRRVYTQLSLTDPAALARMAKETGKERPLADLCIEILQAVGEMPEPPGTLHRYREIPESQHRPMNEFGNYWADSRKYLGEYLEHHQDKLKPVFLDVGGAAGDCKNLAKGYRYWLVDLVPRTAAAEQVIEADICEPLPVQHGAIDVVFSNQVWEHLERPWLACQELGKLLRPGGLFITCTLFAYRYHPFPEDYFRYTHRGLARIHEHYAGTETLVCKYDLTQRRRDIRGGGHLLKSDLAPVDWFGGFRENWYVYYIGRKKGDA